MWLGLIFSIWGLTHPLIALALKLMVMIVESPEVRFLEGPQMLLLEYHCLRWLGWNVSVRGPTHPRIAVALKLYHYDN